MFNKTNLIMGKTIILLGGTAIYAHFHNKNGSGKLISHINDILFSKAANDQIRLSNPLSPKYSLFSTSFRNLPMHDYPKEYTSILPEIDFKCIKEYAEWFFSKDFYGYLMRLYKLQVFS